MVARDPVDGMSSSVAMSTRYIAATHTQYTSHCVIVVRHVRGHRDEAGRDEIIEASMTTTMNRSTRRRQR